MKFSSNAALLCGLTTLGLFSVVGASPIIARQSFPVNSAFDDAHGNGPPGSGLTYSGDWVHLSQQAGLGLNHDTESYTSDPNGSFSVLVPYASDGLSQQFRIQIKSTEKYDRGNFQVALGNGTVLGYGNESYGGDEESQSVLVFDQSNLEIGGSSTLVVKNQPEGDQKFFAVDEVIFYYNAP